MHESGDFNGEEPEVDEEVLKAAELEFERKVDAGEYDAEEAEEARYDGSDIDEEYVDETEKPWDAPFGDKGVGGGRPMLQGADVRFQIGAKQMIDWFRSLYPNNPEGAPWIVEGDTPRQTEARMKHWLPEWEFLLADLLHRMKQIPKEGKAYGMWDPPGQPSIECGEAMTEEGIDAAMENTQGIDWYPTPNFVLKAREKMGDGFLDITMESWQHYMWRQEQLDAFERDGAFIARGRFRGRELLLLQSLAADLEALKLDVTACPHLLDRDTRFAELATHHALFLPILQILGDNLILVDCGMVGQKARAPASPWYQPMQEYPLVAGEQRSLRVVNVTVHLDDSDVDTGGFRVAIGGHKAGRYLPHQKDPTSPNGLATPLALEDPSSCEATAADVRVFPGMILFTDMYTPLKFNPNNSDKPMRAFQISVMSAEDLFDRELGKVKAQQGWEDLSEHRLHLLSGFDIFNKHQNKHRPSDAPTDI